MLQKPKNLFSIPNVFLLLVVLVGLIWGITLMYRRKPKGSAATPVQPVQSAPGVGEIRDRAKSDSLRRLRP